MRRVQIWLVAVAFAIGSLVLPPWSDAGAVTRPSALAAAARYARSQGYHIGIAVLDTRTRTSYGSGDDTGTFASESVVKAMIAARLLVQGRMSGSTARRAWKMITQSDDGIATSFYPSVGGDGLINWVKRHYHVPNLGSPPSSPGWWGNTHITPRGLVTFYARVKRDPTVGPWLLRAMHHARRYGSDGTYQFFGLPSATTGAAVKQGWGCDYASGCDTADFNTTGYVNHDRYAVAVLARGPIKYYGSAIASMLTRTARILLPAGRFPDPRPTLRELTRTKGRASGGQRVGVYGTDFTSVRAVLFGKVRGTAVRVRGAHFLWVTTPAHPTGSYPLRVVTTHGTSPVGALSFTFGRPPAIRAVTPDVVAAGGGSRVTISGVRMGGATRVLFGHLAGTALRVRSENSVSVVAPHHKPGGVDVRVVTAFGPSSTSAADRFHFAGPPTITQVSPTSGPASGGTQLAITGTNLSAVTQVKLGGLPATSLVHVSPLKVTAVTPAHPPGQVAVVAAGPGGTSPAAPGARYSYAG